MRTRTSHMFRRLPALKCVVLYFFCVSSFCFLVSSFLRFLLSSFLRFFISSFIHFLVSSFPHFLVLIPIPPACLPSPSFLPSCLPAFLPSFLPSCSCRFKVLLILKFLFDPPKVFFDTYPRSAGATRLPSAELALPAWESPGSH